MVDSVTSFSDKGLRDWLLQRITAVLVGAYAVFLLGYLIICGSDLSYQKWLTLFANPWMKISTILVLFAVILHAWIGIWTVTTDYVKPCLLRMVVQIVVLLMLLGWLIWGIQILWGVSV